MSAGLNWLKSSHSATDNQCVEVARSGDFMLVRHSKSPDVARLAFTQGEWAAFVAGVAAGELGWEIPR